MLRLVWGPDKYGCYATQTVPVGLLQERLDKLGEEHGEINVTIVPARDYDADQALDLHVTGHEAHE